MQYKAALRRHGVSEFVGIGRAFDIRDMLLYLAHTVIVDKEDDVFSEAFVFLFDFCSTVMDRLYARCLVRDSLRYCSGKTLQLSVCEECAEYRDRNYGDENAEG